MQGVLDARLLLLHLDLGRGTDLDHGNATGELGQPLLQLLAVVVRGGLLDLSADLVAAALDLSVGAGAVDDGGLILADLYALGRAELVEGGLLERQPNLFGDHGTAGEDGDVLQHGLAAIAEARGLDGADLDDAADRVHDQGGQGLALDVLGNDHQRTTGLGDGLEHRQQIADVRDLLVVQQDVGVFQLGGLALLVVDEVRRQVAAVELHALDDVELVVQRLAFLDGDDAFLADLLHRLGDDLADRLIGVGGDGADLSDLLVVGAWLGQLLQLGHRGIDRLVDPPLQVHRVHAGGDRLHALADHRLGQHGGGGGAVAGDIAGLGGDLLDHLRAHVLELVGKLDLLGDADTVFGDGRGAEGLLQHHVATLGTQGDLDGIGEDVDALDHPVAGIEAELHFFCAHRVISSSKTGYVERMLSDRSDSFDGWVRGLAFDDAHDVFFAHHQELLSIELDLGAGVLAEQHLVADLHVEAAGVAVVHDLAVANGDDLALDRLLGGRVRDHDPAGGGTLLFHTTDHDAVMQGTNLHLR